MSDPAQPSLFDVPVDPAKIRALSPKQKKVMEFVVANGQVTLDDAVKLIGTQYTNERFYCGLILSNMAKRGLLRKLKRATYTLP